MNSDLIDRIKITPFKDAPESEVTGTVMINFENINIESAQTFDGSTATLPAHASGRYFVVPSAIEPFSYNDFLKFKITFTSAPSYFYIAYLYP